MSNSLEERKSKILKRLEQTIQSTNTTLIEINQELELMIQSGKEIENVAEVYEVWRHKE